MTLKLDAPAMVGAQPQTDAEATNVSSARKWRPSFLTWAIVILATGGLLAGTYPMTAAWVSSYNQSKIIASYQTDLKNTEPGATEQVTQARAYNEALSAGVVLAKNANVPVGDGSLSDASFDYFKILSANTDGLMARVKIPAIDVDLPIYHGTSDEVLDRGAGHLEGSHFPVGGMGTRSVITAHRGLANATMFTNLNKVEVGDTFTVEAFNEVLTYQVQETRVIEPDATDVLRAVPGSDLMTLITCTPLGINTHRIIVTGQRITPTPHKDIVAAGAAPTIPGFAWWSVLAGSGLLLIATYGIQQGFRDAQIRSRVTPEHKDNDIHGGNAHSIRGK